jgi:hypothetical protein
MPIARARHALDVDRLQAASLFQPRQVVGRVAVVDHVFGDTAIAKVLAGRLDLDEMCGRVAVDELALLAPDLVLLLEVADVARGLKKGARLGRDVREDRNVPVSVRHAVPRLTLVERPHRPIEGR